MAGFLICVLTVGALAAWLFAGRAGREMWAHLLGRARLVANAVDMERFQALTGTVADLGAPDYTRIKRRFAAIKIANDKAPVHLNLRRSRFGISKQGGRARFLGA
ncbi:MAG: hypothetical protein GY859_35635 [Desulfobacterales bacterium]|nr:hypothetical protein [Desulfobacterales bacterium]